MVNRLRVGRPGFGSRLGKIFIFATTSRPTIGSAQPHILVGAGVLSSGLKRPGREANQSSLYSAEVKNASA
jgi:hypothetical protein